MQELLPLNFEHTGKVYRFGRKDVLWAIGKEWEYKGATYRLTHIGDWSTGEKETIKDYPKENNTAHFKKKEKEALTEIAQSLESESSAKNQACADLWAKEWPLIKDREDLHWYIKAKGLSLNHGAKIDDRDTLLVKIINDNGITGVQKIYKSKEGNTEKRYSTGIKKKGSFAHIGEFKDSEYIYMAEGFATAASIFESTGIPVVIALDAGNILEAIRTVRKINPSSKIIICADLDKTEVGVKKANFAKTCFINVIVKTPKFTIKTENQTDFNDLAASEGHKEVEAQLAFTDEDFIKIIPLGYNEDYYFYTSTINSQIVRILSSGHYDKSLFRLAPLDYWKKIASDNEKIQWVPIASDLMKKCHAKGIFNPENIRGKGAWCDDGKYVINDGNDTPRNSRYHYQKSLKVNLSTKEQFSNEEMKQILSALDKILYKNKASHMYLASWIIQAQIFACLPWRFHVWLTGERGSGKSHVIKWVHDSIPLSILTNNATASGIRQETESNAYAVCFDESEPDSLRMNAVIELARQMSSNDGAKTLRGTPAGKSLSSNTQCIFLFGSIQVHKLNAADSSRIFVVELDNTKNQPSEDFYIITDMFENISKNKAKLFARAFNCLPSIVKSRGVVSKILREKRLEARLADQLATALACYHVYNSNAAITVQECENYIEEFSLLTSEYMEDNTQGDSLQCYKDLMNVGVDNDCTTIGMVIEKSKYAKNIQEKEECERILASYNMKYFENENKLFVPSKSQKLIKAMKDFPDLCSVLKRDENICINRRITCRIFGVGVVIGIFILIEK